MYLLYYFMVWLLYICNVLCTSCTILWFGWYKRNWVTLTTKRNAPKITEIYCVCICRVLGCRFHSNTISMMMAIKIGVALLSTNKFRNRGLWWKSGDLCIFKLLLHVITTWYFIPRKVIGNLNITSDLKHAHLYLRCSISYLTKHVPVRIT